MENAVLYLYSKRSNSLKTAFHVVITVLQLRVRKMLDTSAFHPPSCTQRQAASVEYEIFSRLVCLGVGVHLLAVGTSVFVNYVVFNNIF